MKKISMMTIFFRIFKMKKKPERSCIVCRERFNKKELIRIVYDKEGNLFYDPTGKKNGRGAYICKSSDCIEKFLSKNMINNAFKCQIEQEKINKLKEEIRNALD